jgi:hypothetical protein
MIDLVIDQWVLEMSSISQVTEAWSLATNLNNCLLLVLYIYYDTTTLTLVWFYRKMESIVLNVYLRLNKKLKRFKWNNYALLTNANSLSVHHSKHHIISSLEELFKFQSFPTFTFNWNPPKKWNYLQFQFATAFKI